MEIDNNKKIKYIIKFKTQKENSKCVYIGI